MSGKDDNAVAVTTRVMQAGPGRLDAILRLWRPESSTLGYLPAGAFEEAAFAGRIVEAVDSLDSVVGYALYRTPRDYAVLVHLCIAPSWRGRGLTRILVNAVRDRTRGKRGLGLTCRRDFAASDIWPRLGFAWKRDVQARAEGQTSAFWWIDYNEPDLFSRGQESKPRRLVVALDQNVFLDLHGPSWARRDEESESLTADWVQDEIELVVTDEVFNEISSSGRDADERSKLRREAQRYRRAACDVNRLDEVLVGIKALYPERVDRPTESDMRHVARAIAGGVDVFVTRDDGLLERSNEIYQRWGLSVTRPASLVVLLDEHQREHVYQPSRIAGSIRCRRSFGAPADIEQMVARFQRSRYGESKYSFLKEVHRGHGSPFSSAVELIEGAAGLLGICVFSVRDREMTVTMLRCAHGSSEGTVARFLAESAVRRSVDDGLELVRVRDPYLDTSMDAALREAGFQTDASGERVKQNRFGCVLAAEAGALIGRASSDAASIEQAWEAEYVFRPVKLWDLDVHTYIVPIRPGWAANLFDSGLAGEMLIGASDDLALRTELAYYRAAKPGLPNEKARVLWYVSDGHGDFAGRRAVRAYSRLDEVVVGPAKEIYRRFRRLGVYEWRDVLKVAKSPLGQVMVLRFLGTELFRYPVSWAELQECLGRYGRRSQIQSPTKVGREVFRDIYRRGMGV